MIKKAVDRAYSVVMEIETDPKVCAEVAARHALCERNWRWLQANANEAYSHRGKHICVAGQQLFVGDSVREVLRAAAAAHPEDDGRFTLYVPVDKLPRIYAH